MKFSWAALAAVACAQNIHIQSPKPGSVLHRERPTPVTVEAPNNGTTTHEVSIVLSIIPCPDGTCPNAGENLGTLLYTGPYQPAGAQPAQSFNVTVPSAFPVGPAELLATHFVLIGDGHMPYLQIAGEIVFVV